MLIEEELSGKVIGAGIEVHRHLGPGLLESAYEECLCLELELRGIQLKRQVVIPVTYKSIQLECGYRADLVVDDRLVVELKTVDKLMPIHKAQLMTYLRLTGVKIGLLMNFNVPVLKDGIERVAV